MCGKLDGAEDAAAAAAVSAVPAPAPAPAQAEQNVIDIASKNANRTRNPNKEKYRDRDMDRDRNRDKDKNKNTNKIQNVEVFATHIEAHRILHPAMLKRALDEMFGKKRYECDMRLDTYNIFSPRKVSVAEVLEVVGRQEVPKERPTDKSSFWNLFRSYG